MKTLIVHEDRVTAVALRRLLEQRGHEVTLVENARDAWQALLTGDYVLVLAARLTAETDALDLVQRIRDLRKDRVPYIILLCPRARGLDQDSGQLAWADDYLAIPVDPTDLAARVALARRVLDLSAELDRAMAEVARLELELERISDLNETNTLEIRAMCRDLELANAHLKARAITDSLTGLKNHREFQERLEDEVNRATRYNLPLSLVMLDVDHFKRFNDSFGHPAGDEVLIRLAQILEKHARDSDILARYGGEEFAIILANTDREHAIAAAERFSAAIAEESWHGCSITVSMGISTLGIVPQSRADLTTEADMALYECKSRGRNRITHFADTRELA